ncbi:MAG: globin [Planctomycetaceae bacterium]|nr:globin [Planctomycetaceae bacterium]
MTESSPQTVFDVIGEDGLTHLVRGFYEQVPQDEILGPMYPPADLAAAERRLREFLVYRFGGPDRYIVERGHPRLRVRHAPFVIHQAARDRWFQLMNTSLDRAEFAPEIVAALRTFFAETASFLINSDG